MNSNKHKSNKKRKLSRPKDHEKQSKRKNLTNDRFIACFRRNGNRKKHYITSNHDQHLAKASIDKSSLEKKHLYQSTKNALITDSFLNKKCTLALFFKRSTQPFSLWSFKKYMFMTK